MAMAALLAGLLGEGATPAIAGTVLAIGIPALALDGVDGWLARRSRMASDFGARFDMETDAALLLILCALAWQLDKAGAWILARRPDALRVRRRRLRAGPGCAARCRRSMRRKTVCVVQIIALFVVHRAFRAACGERAGGRGFARAARLVVRRRHRSGSGPRGAP